MPEQTQGMVEIDAARVKVMEVITDFEAYPEWAQGVKKTQVTGKDSRGRPSEVAFDVGMMGIGARYTLKYRYRAANSGLTWTSTDASGAVKSVQGEYALQSAGKGRTSVTFRTTLEPAINLGGLMRRHVERTIINSALGGLKKRVEAR
jgi:ribosome-associated toxin RatA of RatAB toxin-antitoxin module